jgi:metal-responsive CopG/Arc/MetJ family transcriptional regulator
MANMNEVSITLPAALVESALAVARREKCTMDEVLRRALDGYEAVDRLTSALGAGEERSEALDNFIEEYVDKIIHEHRVERRARIEAVERKAC